MLKDDQYLMLIDEKHNRFEKEIEEAKRCHEREIERMADQNKNRIESLREIYEGENRRN